MKLARFVVALLCLGVTVPRAARAEATRFFELEGFGHFLDGNPESTAVTEDGAVALAPRLHERFSDAAASFSAACGYGDEVVVARVEDAQVLGIDPKGKLRSIFKPHEGMVTALYADQETLYIAAGPGGKIYRIGKNAVAEVFVTLDANYVWSLAAGPKGLLAATGEPGTVTEISRDGKTRELFRPEQAHLRALAYEPSLGIFVGGAERGVVYRAAPGKPFLALYDTGATEITALVAQGDAVFAAGVSGAASLLQDDGKKGGKPPEVRSQVLRLGMDGAADVLAGSADEAVFALAAGSHDNVLVATGATGRDDPRGRIYSIDPARRVIAMLAQSPSRRVTHLVRLGDALVAVAAAGGRLTDVAPGYANKGEFYTSPFDTGGNSAFGLAQLLGHFPKGSRAELAARSGQTGEPDSSWSPWSAGVAAPGSSSVHIPNGRFVQLRLSLQGKDDVSPLVQRLRLAYLRNNMPPFVRDVTVLKKGTALYPLPHDDGKANKMILLADKAEDGGREDAAHRGQSVRARQVQERGALTIKWVADDPNGDDLRFELAVRSTQEDHWRTLRQNLREPFITLQAGQFPDGHYIFRVRASDAHVNPAGLGRHDSRDSSITLVDNTPPRFAPIKLSFPKDQVEARSKVADSVGPIVELYYALDAGDPRPVLPDDGLLDGPAESISLYLGRLQPGHHTLTLRAVDEADNEGFAEARFEVR